MASGDSLSEKETLQQQKLYSSTEVAKSVDSMLQQSPGKLAVTNTKLVQESHNVETVQSYVILKSQPICHTKRDLANIKQKENLNAMLF